MSKFFRGVVWCTALLFAFGLILPTAAVRADDGDYNQFWQEQQETEQQQQAELAQQQQNYTEFWQEVQEQQLQQQQQQP
jgi:hypothetical protein